MKRARGASELPFVPRPKNKLSGPTTTSQQKLCIPLDVYCTISPICNQNKPNLAKGVKSTKGRWLTLMNSNKLYIMSCCIKFLIYSCNSNKQLYKTYFITITSLLMCKKMCIMYIDLQNVCVVIKWDM